jgi:hypothetical protein
MLININYLWIKILNYIHLFFFSIQHINYTGPETILLKEIFILLVFGEGVKNYVSVDIYLLL